MSSPGALLASATPEERARLEQHLQDRAGWRGPLSLAGCGVFLTVVVFAATYALADEGILPFVDIGLSDAGVSAIAGGWVAGAVLVLLALSHKKGQRARALIQRDLDEGVVELLQFEVKAAAPIWLVSFRWFNNIPRLSPGCVLDVGGQHLVLGDMGLMSREHPATVPAEISLARAPRTRLLLGVRSGGSRVVLGDLMAHARHADSYALGWLRPGSLEVAKLRFPSRGEGAQVFEHTPWYHRAIVAASFWESAVEDASWYGETLDAASFLANADAERDADSKGDGRGE